MPRRARSRSMSRSTRRVHRDPDPSAGERLRLAARRIGVRSRQVAFQSLVWAAGLLDRGGRRQVLFASALISDMSGNLKPRSTTGWSNAASTATSIWSPCSSRVPASSAGCSGGSGWPERWPGPRSSSSTTPIRRCTGWSSRPTVRIIQLWHAAGAFKTVGYSRVGKPDRRRPFRSGPQGLHRSHRQLRPRHPVLRRGVRDPGGTGHPDRDPADGPLLRRAGEGCRPGRGARRLSPIRGPVRRSCSRRRSVARPRSATYRLRPARLRRTPRAGGREGRDRHHQDASVRAPAAGHPGGVAGPSARRVDGDHRRQRPAVRRRPAHHRLFVDRVRVLDPGPADAVLRLRSRRLRRQPRLLRAVRVVRAGPDRADVSRAARRDPPRRLPGREGRRLRRRPFRAPRRSARPTG